MRVRRAYPFPRPSRTLPSTVKVSMCPSLNACPRPEDPSYISSNEQFADRNLFVNRLNAAGQQRRNAEHLNLRQISSRLAERDGIGNDNFLDLRFHDSIDGRPAPRSGTESVPTTPSISYFMIRSPAGRESTG